MSNKNVARQIGHMAGRMLDQINEGKDLAKSDLVIMCKATETLCFEYRRALDELANLRGVFGPKVRSVELPTFVERGGPR